jgi:signal transduction histidine kinase
LDATDDERGQRLLDTLLLVITVVVLLATMLNVVVGALGMGGGRVDLTRMNVVSVAVLLGNGLIFMLNRRSPWLAKWLLVLLVFVAAILSDSPQQIASGRTLIALAVPVVAANILLHPFMGFVVASLGCLTTYVVAHSLDMWAPTPSMAMLFLIALIVALLVHALERTRISWCTANKNLVLLNQTSQALSSTLDLDRVLVTVLDEVRRLLGAVASSVWLTDSETGELVCWQVTEPQGELVRGWRLAPGEGLAGWVACTDESLIVPDIRTDKRHFKGVDRTTGLPIRSIVSVPLRLREDVIGVLQVVDADVDRFKPTDLELLEPLAATAAIAIENARLYAEEQQRATALARALEQQQELDRLKDEFLQNISHELRTPLALILGYAELMNSGELGELQSNQRGPVSVIARRVRMLSKMVNDLIAILAVEALELREEVVDLADLVRTMLVDFRVAAEEAELSLTAEVAPDLPPVFGDPDQLHRMLDNLLGNALKFTPTGGRLTIRLWRYGDGKAVVLDVTDTGIGIPPDQLGRVFDRFYQIDGSSKRRYGGVGLGLALVKEIVEAHGGQVSVWSVVNEGSTFRVTLPAMPASQVVECATGRRARDYPGRDLTAVVTDSRRYSRTEAPSPNVTLTP